MKNIIKTILITFLTLTVNAQNITGNWTGTTNIGKGKKIIFNFNISADESKKFNTVISIPTAGVSGLKPEKTTFENNKLVVDGSNIGIGFSGIYNPQTKTIKGVFKEGINTINLSLSKDDFDVSYERPKRPQEPKKPLPYISENISFKSVEEKVVLAGTLTKPKSDKKLPAVILISGSGPSDRDETFANHKPFLVISDYLTRNGIAVLRYDDRGRGSSTGNYANATTFDFAKDAAGAIQYLKQRKDIKTNSIGIIGHSEGGIIAPLVINKLMEKVAFIITMAGTAIPGSELSLIQSKTLRPFPVPDEEAYEVAIREAINIASKNGEREEIKTKLKAHYYKTIKPILDKVTGNEKQSETIIQSFVEDRTKPWSRYFYKYNPADEYQKIKVPVLGLYGTKDIQVLAEINAPALEKALKNSKSKNYQVKVFEGMNHLFQKADTGKISEYEKIEQTISPLVLNEMLSFINEVVK